MKIIKPKSLPSTNPPFFTLQLNLSFSFPFKIATEGPLSLTYKCRHRWGDILSSRQDALSCTLCPQRWLWAHLTSLVTGMRLTTNTKQQNVPLGKLGLSGQCAPHSSKWSWWLWIKMTSGRSVHLMFTIKAAICAATTMAGSRNQKPCSPLPILPDLAVKLQGRELPSSLPEISFQLAQPGQAVHNCSLVERMLPYVLRLAEVLRSVCCRGNRAG